MFLMTSNITIGDFTAIKPKSVKWKCSVSNFVDTCSIELPLRTYLRANDNILLQYPDGTTEKRTSDLAAKQGVIFTEGLAVSVDLGYNNRNTTRFMGFVKRINYGKPLVIECEGYSYLLKDKVFTKTYTTTTVKSILNDLVTGTDILLSDAIPVIPLKNVVFKNCPGLKVLEWMQKELLLSVFFDFNTLYVGSSKYGLKKPTVKLQLGWNTVDDGGLKKDVKGSEIIIHVIAKDSAGKVKRTKSDQKKYSTTKEVKIRSGMPDAIVKEISNELQKLENFSGYKGDITCFLEPHIENGFVVKNVNDKFPDREGNFFVESVDGSFSSSGGRQVITLRYYGNVDGTGS